MSSAWREIETMARSRLPVVLAGALGVAPKQIRVKEPSDAQHDFVLLAPGYTLLVDVLARPAPATLTSHWNRLRRPAAEEVVPVLAVPFMTAAGKAWCSEHGVNWLDFSGNARLRAPGLHIRVEGNPNSFARRGRPSSVFERRSSRVARVLLQQPGREWSVRECARETGLNDGHVSRIVARLVEDQLVARDEKRRFRVRDARLLLDAWRDSAEFSKHRILRGHVAARSGEELLRALSRRLDESHIDHAATGLGAAWLYDHFARFRLTTFFVREWPTPAQLENLHFRDEEAGANVWLVLPNDDGVFVGMRTVEDVPCVHPVQTYVDLKGQPERAADATEHLGKNTALLGIANAAS